MTFREMTVEDLEQVVEIENRLFSDPWTKEGFLYFDWNALSGDAVNFNLSPERLNQNILTDVKKQKVSIVLMHDLAEAENTVKSLDSLIKTLKKEGYQILPITKYTQQIHHVSVDK